VFTAGKAFVYNVFSFQEISSTTSNARSASFPISNASNLSKSFFVSVGTAGFDNSTPVGI
jgi:hypothetical protein